MFIEDLKISFISFHVKRHVANDLETSKMLRKFAISTRWLHSGNVMHIHVLWTNKQITLILRRTFLGKRLHNSFVCIYPGLPNPSLLVVQLISIYMASSPKEPPATEGNMSLPHATKRSIGWIAGLFVTLATQNIALCLFCFWRRACPTINKTFIFVEPSAKVEFTSKTHPVFCSNIVSLLLFTIGRNNGTSECDPCTVKLCNRTQLEQNRRRDMIDVWPSIHDEQWAQIQWRNTSGNFRGWGMSFRPLDVRSRNILYETLTHGEC